MNRFSARGNDIGYGKFAGWSDGSIIYLDPLGSFWEISGNHADPLEVLTGTGNLSLGNSWFIGKMDDTYLFSIGQQIYGWRDYSLSPMGRSLFATGKYENYIAPRLSSISFNGSTLLYGSVFSFTDGTPVYGIVYWDGSDWKPAFKHEFYESSGLYLVTEYGGHLYGSQTDFNAVNQLVRLNASESDWASSEWDYVFEESAINLFYINDMTVFDGYLHIAGSATINGEGYSGLFRFDGEHLEHIDTGYGYSVSGMVVHKNRLYTIKAHDAAQWTLRWFDGERFQDDGVTLPITGSPGLAGSLDNSIVIASPNGLVLVSNGQKSELEFAPGSAPTAKVQDDMIFISGNFQTVDHGIPAAGSVMFSPASVQRTLPSSANLNPNYPNPFNNETVISFELLETARVKLEIYSVDGRLVDILAEQVYSEGTYELAWRPQNLASGVYIARLFVNDRQKTGKMMLIK